MSLLHTPIGWGEINPLQPEPPRQVFVCGVVWNMQHLHW
jgi:hypothetical protein